MDYKTKMDKEMLKLGWNTNGVYWWIDGCEGMDARDAYHYHQWPTSYRWWG